MSQSLKNGATPTPVLLLNSAGCLLSNKRTRTPVCHPYIVSCLRGNRIVTFLVETEQRC